LHNARKKFSSLSSILFSVLLLANLLRRFDLAKIAMLNMVKLRVSPTVETLGVSITRNANGYALGFIKSKAKSFALGETKSFTNS